jgi:hypothetical protein
MMLLEIQSGRIMQTDELSLTIKDKASGELLAAFRLLPAEAWKLLGGSSLTVEADVSPNLHRVGQEMVVSTAVVPRDVTPHSMSAESRLLAAETWAREVVHPGWDEYQARTRNDGLVEVVCRGWAPEDFPAREGE